MVGPVPDVAMSGEAAWFVLEHIPDPHLARAFLTTRTHPSVCDGRALEQVSARSPACPGLPHMLTMFTAF